MKRKILISALAVSCAAASSAAQKLVYFGDCCWMEDELWTSGEVLSATGVAPLVVSGSGDTAYAWLTPSATNLVLKASVPEGWAFREGTVQWAALDRTRIYAQSHNYARAARDTFDKYGFENGLRFDGGDWSGNPLSITQASFSSSAKEVVEVAPCFHWLRYDLEFSPNRPDYDYYFSATLRQRNLVYTNDVAIGEMPEASAWKYPHHTFLGLSPDAAASEPSFTFGEKIDSSDDVWPGKKLGARTDGDTNGVVVLYAVWKPHVVTISLDASGGVAPSNTLWMTGTDVCPDLPEPVLPGWFFDGWFDGETRVSGGDTLDRADGETVSLAAKWIENNFEVALSRGDGAESGDVSVAARNGYPMPPAAMPARAGYDFLGYFSRSGGEGVKYYEADGSSAHDWDLASGETLYAAWSAKTYELALDDNGGSGGSGTLEARYGSGVASLAIPSRTGYSFDGYRTATAGGEMVFDASGSGEWKGLAPRTLYARWEPVEYSVHYDFAGGVSCDGNPSSAVYGVPFHVGKPVRSGYAFAGFEVSGECNSATAAIDGDFSSEYAEFSNLATVSGASVLITAKWEEAGDDPGETEQTGEPVELSWWSQDGENDFVQGKDPQRGVHWSSEEDVYTASVKFNAENGKTYLAGSVAGSGTLVFEWRIRLQDDEDPCDFANFYEDNSGFRFAGAGLEKRAVSTEWTEVSVPVEAAEGVATGFKWYADKFIPEDGSGARGYIAEVRNVKWIAAAATDGGDGETPARVFETLPPVPVSALSCKCDYDGLPHGIEVKCAATNEATVLYSATKDGVYSETPVTRVSATEGPVEVWYSVSAEGYASVTNCATIEIARAANAWAAGPAAGGGVADASVSLPCARSAFGKCAVSYSIACGEALEGTPETPGEWIATFTVPETDDYAGLEESVAFTIVASETSYSATFSAGTGEGEPFSSEHGFFEIWEIPKCPFERDMYVFAGWSADPAAAPDDPSLLRPGDKVWSLTDEDGGEVAFHAIWTPLVYSVVAVAAPESSAKGSVAVSAASVEPGASAKLTAKASNSSTLFAYWLDETGKIVSLKSSATVTPSATSSYKAVFRLKSKCAKPQFGSTVWGDDGFPSVNEMAGVGFKAQVSVNREAYPVKFKASGLPSGLKIDAATGVISGVPSKAGTYTATITATSAASSSKKASKKVKIVVAALPAWARGTFTGEILGEDGEIAGTASISVTTAGKFSGSFVSGGTNWTVATTGYAAASVATSGVFTASGTATRTVGKTTEKLAWTFAPERDLGDGEDGTPGGERTLAGGTLGDGRTLWFQRYFWKDSAAAPYLPGAGWPGLYVAEFEDGGKISFSLDKAGVVKASRDFDVYDSAAKKDVVKTRTVSTKLLYIAGEDGSVAFAAPVYYSKTTSTKKNSKGKVTSKIAYPESIEGEIELVNALRPADGGEAGVAYRLPGVVPSVDPASDGSGSFKYSTSYGQAEAGTAVTVTAVPAKGSVFAYWTRLSADGGEPEIVSYSAAYKVVLGEENDTGLAAVFRKKTKCAAPKFGSDVWGADGFPSVNEMAGVAFKAQVSVNRDAYPVKFKASGLPSGLKVNATSGAITGVPSKAGTYTATITATSAANSKKASKKVKIVIAALPAWARGTFTGEILGKEGEIAGTASISVTAAGKFSGSFVSGGTNWTVTATGYAATSVATSGVFLASGTATRTVDKTTLKLAWTFAPERDLGDGEDGTPGGERTLAGGTLGDGRSLWFQRYFWKDSAAAAYLAGAGWPGTYVAQLEDGGTISFTLDKEGVVKASRAFEVYDSATKKNLVKTRTVSTKLLFIEGDGGEAAFAAPVYYSKTTSTKKNSKGKVTSKIAYPESIEGEIGFANAPRPGDGGEPGVAYRQ